MVEIDVQPALGFPICESSAHPSPSPSSAPASGPVSVSVAAPASPSRNTSTPPNSRQRRSPTTQPTACPPHRLHAGSDNIMTGRQAGRASDPAELLERETLCLTQPKPNAVLHSGDDGFRKELGTWYDTAESNATERLVQTKRKLQQASDEEFWTMATEALAELSGAQYAFISKRMVIDEQDAAVEMPPYGQPGSCLMAQAFYYNDGHGHSGNETNVKYFVYGCPCEHMRHDKVFLVPNSLSEVIPNNPNSALLPVLAEGYLALPLSKDGRCFAHFGVMWSAEGLANKKLSYAFIELMFHALEDVILEGFLERGQFSSSATTKPATKKVIPHQAVTAAQSLKPYARSLSHELRTPMQGVVGMLDVMYASVREVLEGLSDQRIRQVFETLKENIEVVQDSSRRAVEAADNVVHAYDMNMGVPDQPAFSTDEEEAEDNTQGRRPKRDRRPEIVVTGEHVPLNFTRSKRRRTSIDAGGAGSSSTKRRRADETPPPRAGAGDVAALEDPSQVEAVGRHLATPETGVVPGLRHTSLRDMLQYLVFDLLKVGGRPESAIAKEIEGGGEEIEVTTKYPDGTEKVKIVRWVVAPSVPETILIDEKDLIKMISCVFLNAVKFTEEGNITLIVRMSPKQRYLVINVNDTGPGIPETFLPNMFKAFAKEDTSLTRRSEGLGLGLLVAKGLARKLGGDLACTRSATSGPSRGTEFEIRLPITPIDGHSRQVSPFGSPAPSHRTSRSVSKLASDRDQSSGPSQTSAPKFDPLPQIAFSSRVPHSRKLSSTSISKGHFVPTDSAQPSPTQLPPILDFDPTLAQKYPLTFLVVEDNKINRRLLVNMLKKLGYEDTYEAYDGADAVRCMQSFQDETTTAGPPRRKPVDVILMDLWMPYMDGYEASERILQMEWPPSPPLTPDAVVLAAEGFPLPQHKPTILAVTADVTHGALERAHLVGMKGFLTKPYKLRDLERLILEYCATTQARASPKAELVKHASDGEVCVGAKACC